MGQELPVKVVLKSSSDFMGSRVASESCAEVFFFEENKSNSPFPQRSTFCFRLLFFTFWRLTAKLNCTLFRGQI